MWVSGARQGIGRAAAAAFARSGATVVGLDRQYETEDMVDGIRCVPLDVARAEDVDAVARRLLAEYGRIDALIHAAGILHSGTITSLSPEQWNETLAVNATGAFNLLRRVLPALQAQRRGAIVVVASNAASVPRIGMAAYCASKAALRSLAQCAALELASFGVRCNSISPGSTDTPMQRALWRSEDGAAQTIAGDPAAFRLGIPLGKLATPDDVAQLALFLASDLAGHLTMQDVVIDGGATLGA